MAVPLRGDNTFVAEEFLNPSQRHAGDREPACERVAQRVEGNVIAPPGSFAVQAPVDKETVH